MFLKIFSKLVAKTKETELVWQIVYHTQNLLKRRIYIILHYDVIFKRIKIFINTKLHTS